MKVLLPTGLHDRVAQIVGIKQDHDLDARRGLELPDELAPPTRWSLKGELPRLGHWAFLTYSRMPQGITCSRKTRMRTDILVPPDVGVESSGLSSWPPHPWPCPVWPSSNHQ